MNAEDVQVSGGELDRPYKVIGKIKFKLRRFGLSLTKYPTEEQAFRRLREEAARRGANAVVWATTTKVHPFLSSGRVLVVTGTAVWAEVIYRGCPHCKEPMRRDASVCPHCRMQSEPWEQRDGYWWATFDGQRRYLEERSGEWLAPAQ